MDEWRREDIAYPKSRYFGSSLVFLVSIRLCQKRCTIVPKSTEFLKVQWRVSETKEVDISEQSFWEKIPKLTVLIKTLIKNLDSPATADVSYGEAKDVVN